jgi:hypothetical protein
MNMIFRGNWELCPLIYQMRFVHFRGPTRLELYIINSVTLYTSLQHLKNRICSWLTHCNHLSGQITVTAKYKTQHIYWQWLRLRTKKGLQGGKTIQQRSEFFASLVPNASTSSLAHALVRSLHTHVCVYLLLWVYSAWRVSHYCSFSGAGTHDSDGPLGLNVVTY